MGPKPAMSITLPRNFTFHYNDGQTPHTPAPNDGEQEVEVTEPPPPPRQTFKVRRRKADSVPRDIMADMGEDEILPTIEMTEADFGNSSPDSIPEMLPGYLAPQSSRLPLLSPPKTPIEQITEYDFSSKTTDWAHVRADPIERPESACSSFSDSSASSFSGSLRSFPSLGSLGATGSCTSPESEADPFAVHEAGEAIFSPEIIQTSPTAKRARTERDARWTTEMDDHLWFTFLKYLQDPELTPFKMLPGTAPPLGVCGRVAREAKHSWKQGRALGAQSMSRRKAMPLFEAALFASPQSAAKTWSHWPCTESGTRKRLRKLCKKTPSLSAHYQRLMHTRTPSPFQSSSPQPQTERHPSSTDSVRTLKEAFGVPAPAVIAPSSPPVMTAPRKASVGMKADDWYKRIGRSQAHQKSQSLQFALGGYGPTLASPFDAPSTSSEVTPRVVQPAMSLGRAQGLNHEPVLKSPLELHAPVPTSRSLKRRFGILDSSPANVTRLESLFAGPSQETPRPVRDRAFSLGAVYSSSRSFQRQTSDEPMPDVPPIPAHLRTVAAADTTRLGSPFGGPITNQHNTFPRLSGPSLSLTGKFREMAAQGRI